MPGQNKAVACSYYKAYETGDIEVVMRFVAPNYILHPGGTSKAMNFEERKQDEMVFFSAFSDIKTVVEDQIAEDDKVANRVTMHCTHTGKYQGVPATGTRVTIPYIDILRINAEKIVEEWVEFDMMSIISQIKDSRAKQK